MQPDNQPPFYGYGTVEDEPFTGPCATFDAAVTEGFTAYDDAESIWICEGYPVKVRDYVGAHRILEQIAEDAADEVGEIVGEWLTRVPADKIQELEELIAAWVIKHYPPKFWLTKNSKQVFRKDYPDLPQLMD